MGAGNFVTIAQPTASGWGNGTTVALSAAPLQARLSRDGTTILYLSTTSLVAHNTATGRETILDAGASMPWISDDGKLALYLAPAESGGPLEVFVQNTDGSGGG